MTRRKRQSVREQKRHYAIRRYGFGILAELDELLIESNTTYWLYGGTLLGMVRDKGFIESDTDIDLGLWDTALNHRRLEELLGVVGFSKIYEYGLDGEVLLQRFEKNQVGVDFWYFRKNSEYSYATGFTSDRKGFYVVEDRYAPDAFDRIKNIKIEASGSAVGGAESARRKNAETNSVQLCIPADYQNILAAFYGDWQTPHTKEQGYVHFRNPNQVHLPEMRATRRDYAKSGIQVSLGERIRNLLGLPVVDD